MKISHHDYSAKINHDYQCYCGIAKMCVVKIISQVLCLKLLSVFSLTQIKINTTVLSKYC